MWKYYENISYYIMKILHIILWKYYTLYYANIMKISSRKNGALDNSATPVVNMKLECEM